jgi:hypothetical protein
VQDERKVASKKKRGPNKDKNIIMARDPIEQMESDSSVSNPRNIASNDLLRL